MPPPTARSAEGSAAERVAGPRTQPRARPIRGVMAKVGEGDERWIVKERADGQNCNNWHWTTKDVSGHTKKVRSGASSFAAPRAVAPASSPFSDDIKKRTVVELSI